MNNEPLWCRSYEVKGIAGHKGQLCVICVVQNLNVSGFHNPRTLDSVSRDALWSFQHNHVIGSDVS